MIKVGIIGATGYAGAELVRILMNHKEAEIKWFGSRSYIDQNYADVYQNFFEIVDAKCLDDNMDELASQVDVIFTATPQGFLAGVLSEEILSKVKIVDLSADFRIKDVATYEKWYKIEHKSPQFIEEAVYGLCEINREKVTKDTRQIANPVCYTTCSILTAYPLVKEGIIDPDTLIIDAKSGTSGAGRGAKTPNLFCEVNESMKAYGVTTHRHTPEIAEMMIAEIPPEQTMWVISNEKGINGAASMLYENELHELAESLESDLYILPSSVHEVIAVSSDMGSPEMLAQMVVEVNMQEVSLDERLSNQVYHYDKDLRKLTLATDTPNKRLDGIVAEPPLVYDAKEKSR